MYFFAFLYFFYIDLKMFPCNTLARYSCIKLLLLIHVIRVFVLKCYQVKPVYHDQVIEIFALMTEGISVIN